MPERRDTRFVLFVGLLVLALVTIPYLIAFRSGQPEYVFGGFLLNPLDGNTYLAKIYQGWEGSWRFELPFTAEPGPGAYLNLFYLFLGHLARITGLRRVAVFHLARIVGTIFLLWTLWRYYAAIFEDARPRKLAFALGALGSGMGWLLIPAGTLTADFWVAETYPFLSACTNPHFPIGLALVLWLVMPSFDRPLTPRAGVLTALGAFVLSLISPFGVVVSLVVLGGVCLWRVVLRDQSASPFWRAALVGAFGIPVLAYDLWVANTHPA